jgi:hypothetical protein
MSSKKKKQRPRETIEEPGARNGKVSGGEASVIPAEDKPLPDEAGLKRFIESGQAAQQAVNQICGGVEEPEAARVKFENAVWVEGGRLNQYWQYFMAKGVNPFRQSRHEIERALKHFEDEFDSRASQKGVTVN